jgi:hypothetical protein
VRFVRFNLETDDDDDQAEGAENKSQKKIREEPLSQKPGPVILKGVDCRQGRQLVLR